MTALDLIQAQKVAAVENGITSETFTLDPSGAAVSFGGIFTDSPEEENTREMNVTRKHRSPAIMVASIPTGAAQGKTIVKADGGEFYPGKAAMTISYISPDESGVSIIWLA